MVFDTQTLASELLSVHRWMSTINSEITPEFQFLTPVELLEDLASSSASTDFVGKLPLFGSSMSSFPMANGSKGHGKHFSHVNRPSLTRDEKQELVSLKARLLDSDNEIARLTEQLKKTRSQLAQMTEQGIVDKSERDFYRMKWADVDPEASKILASTLSGSGAGDSESSGESSVARKMAEYIREITELKNELAEARRAAVLGNDPTLDSSKSKSKTDKPGALQRRASVVLEAGEEADGEEFDSVSSLLESELTTSVAR